MAAWRRGRRAGAAGRSVIASCPYPVAEQEARRLYLRGFIVGRRRSGRLTLGWMAQAAEDMLCEVL